MGSRSAPTGMKLLLFPPCFFRVGLRLDDCVMDALVRNCFRWVFSLPPGTTERAQAGHGFACQSRNHARFGTTEPGRVCASTNEHNPVTGRPGSRCRPLRAASPLARCDATAEERTDPPPQLRCGLTRIRAHSCGCPVRQTACCRCPPAFHGCPGPALVRHPDRGSKGELAMIFAL